jgi:SAM-dependent methyltransferase
MKPVKCNLCGQANAKVITQGGDLLLNKAGDFKLVECRHCGLIYQNPKLTLEELPQYYPDTYQPYLKNPEDEASPTQRFSNQHQVDRRCRHVIKHAPHQGHILDIGCATGLFLNGMKQAGWQTSGVELSTYAATYAQQQFGLSVFNGTVEAAAFPDEQFDVVTMWDVLEHVIDPLATLHEIRRILKPGGMLAVSLPNPIAFERYWFKDSWAGWDRPRHLHLFTPDVLQAYFAKTGLKLKEIDSLGGRLGLTLLSAEFWFKEKQVAKSKWKPLLTFLYTPPFRILTFPFYRIGEKLNRTTSMVVFALK